VLHGRYYGVHLCTGGSKHKWKINGKAQKPVNVCEIVRKVLQKKYVKGDFSIRNSLKKTVSQRLGSHRPHGTTAGL